jgi:hypothetical protein
MGSAAPTDEAGTLDLSSFDRDLFGRNRYAYLPLALSHAVLGTLSNYRPPSLSPLTPTTGRVTQRASAGPIGDLRVLEVCRRIEHDILTAIPEWGEQQPGFAFNELLYQRYGTEGYVSPHRDHLRYIGIIVLVTISGSASFSVLRERDDECVLAQWNVSPGDIVLLHGADLDGIDRRPFHCVNTPIGGSRALLSMRCDRELIYGERPFSGITLADRARDLHPQIVGTRCRPCAGQ